jgi:uncharacterized protein YbcI
MPGFDFRYRLGGGPPTIRSVMFKNTMTLTSGDMLNFEGSMVDIGALGDTALLGAARETLSGEAGKTYIRVIADADAVYAADDPSARTGGDPLELTGATGAQGVATGSSELVVVADCTADEPTLVRIADGRHHEIGDEEDLGRLMGGDLNASVARAVVRAHRHETGRGPTKARAFYRGDIIVVVLEDLMTRAERRLVDRGESEAVLNMRRALQTSMRASLVTAMEALTGAKVRAFMSSNNLDPDIAVQVFVMDRPIGGEEVL